MKGHLDMSGWITGILLDFVIVDPQFYRPAEVNELIADATKARIKLGWEPKVSFDELVSIMIEADIDRVKRSLMTIGPKAQILQPPVVGQPLKTTGKR